MPKQQQFSAKSLKHTLFVASNDLNHALQEMVNQLICFDATKDKILSSVEIAAQRMLYLKITDMAAGFDMDLPEYAQAVGTVVRRMVDAEAKRCAVRLYQDMLIL
jgi:hypothetical protein